MLVLLPPAAAAVLVYLHWRGARQWREAIVLGAVVSVGTEALGLVRGITRGGVAGYWAAVLVVLMVLAGRAGGAVCATAHCVPKQASRRMRQRGLGPCAAGGFLDAPCGDR